MAFGDGFHENERGKQWVRKSILVRSRSASPFFVAGVFLKSVRTRETTGESNGSLALSAIIGGTKSGKVCLSMLTEVSRQELLCSVNRTIRAPFSVCHGTRL
jgi:hypothetical protein